MRVLILGSTVLSYRVAMAIQASVCHRVVGFLPSKKPTVEGPVGLICPPWDGERYDLRLSVQFDQRLEDDGVTWNLHTGILGSEPSWGGCDILYHTLKEGASHQGLSFHKITKDFDRGPLLSTISYPVLKGDDVVALYGRMLAVGPSFAVNCLDLLAMVGLNAELPSSGKPRMFKRGKIAEEDREEYARTLKRLKEEYG